MMRASKLQTYRLLTRETLFRFSLLSPLPLIIAFPILLGSLLPACGGSGGGTAAPPATNLESITIDPVNSSIAVGTKVQLHATGTFKNKTTKDITASVSWESANERVVMVSKAAAIRGLAAGSGVGATSVRAKLHGITGVSSFTVTKASLKSITVQPVNPLVARGTTVQVAALGNFSDGSVQDLTTQVSWSSANSSIAQVGNTASTIGVVRGVNVGKTPITASFKGIQGSTTVTVTAATVTSITIILAVPSIARGTTSQETATCNLSDATTEECTSEVNWTSGNSGIAQVSNTPDPKGLVTAVGVGATTISASLGSIQASATISVTGATLTSLTIAPPAPAIAKGTASQLTATGNFSDGTTQDCTIQVSWTSGNNAMAQVSNVPGTQGLVTALGVGSTPISATFNGIQGSATVTATAATLTSLTITPPNRSIAKGTTTQLTATGNFSDGTTEDLTSEVSWTSGDNTIEQISDAPGTQGLVSGVGVGSTAITASLNGVQGSTALTVTAATLVSFTITPPGRSIAKGSTTQLIATGNFSDGTTQDCTIQVSWTSGNNTIAQVSNAAGTQGLVAGMGVGSTTITVTLNGVQASTTFTVTAATLVSLTITPPEPSIARGSTTQLTATGNFSDGTTQDCTIQVSWTSGNNTTAQVSNVSGTQGLVTGINVGSTPINATLNGIVGTTTATVGAATLVSLTITPPGPSIAKGTTMPLTATGNFTDGSTADLTTQVSWTSGNNTTAQVSNVSGTQGLVTGINVGSAPINATLNGIAGTTTATVGAATLVSLTITPPGPSIAKGTAVGLTATGNFTDGSTQDLTIQVSWTSGNNTIAQVSNVSGTQGLVTGINIGSTPINATLNGIVGTATVTIGAATLTGISVTDPVATVAKGTTAQLTATGTFSDGTTEDLTTQVSWTSGNNTIAQVSNAAGNQGLVAGINIGNTPITATFNGIQGAATVVVSPATLTGISVTDPVATVAKGTTVQLTATGTFSDGTTEDLTNQVSWTSGDNTIAQVSNAAGTEGLVTGINLGPTPIMATLTGIQGSATVTVSPATLVSITITAPVASIAKGTSVQFMATGNFTDGSTQDFTNQVGWTSADNTIAQVSNAAGTQGLVTGINLGPTTITVTFNGIQGSALVTVSAAILQTITVGPPNPSISSGTTVQLAATGNFSDGTTQDLTSLVSWTSAANTIAVVSNASGTQGLVEGLSVANTSISATLSGISGSTTVTVTAATLVSIAVTPTNPTIALGTTVQLTATGTFTDGTTQDLTQSVSWTSAAVSVAPVGPDGLITGIAVGSAVVTATQGGVSGSITVTVTAATLTTISVTPANPSIANGTEVLLSATCIFSDGTTQSCSSQVSWTSGNTAIVQVSNDSGTQGVVTGLAIGNAAITATLNGISGSTTVTVTAATLVSISVTPANPTLFVLQSIQMTATAVFSDGTTQDVTLQANWTSSNGFVAFILSDFLPLTNGTVTALFPGSATMTATIPSLGNAQGSTVINVAL